MDSQLKPTLWRTCRTLANRHRLRLLQELAATPGQTVSALANRLGVSMPTASLYLRALNARGLLRAKRVGRNVLYHLRPNPSVPQAEPLVGALQQVFAESTDPIDSLFQQATAFTHPRRVEIVAVLTRQPESFQGLLRQTSISPPALHRHLAKLRARGFVAKTNEVYNLTAPLSPVGAALVQMAVLEQANVSYS